MENGAGAGGSIGTAAAAKAPPEGYTLLLGHTVKEIQTQIANALATPEMKERMAAEGAEPVSAGSDEFAALIRRENEKWSKLKRTGIKPR